MYVQRLRRHDEVREDAKGVDRWFSMEYMGSTEFECGILCASLKVARKQPNLKLQFNSAGIKFWFVGPQDHYETAAAFVYAELSGERQRLKESTMMKPSVDGESWAKDTIGWWWLSQDGWPNAGNATLPTWAVFIHEKDAGAWKDGLTDG